MLELRKTIVIQNIRIRLFFYVLLAGCVVFNAYRFFTSYMYTTTVPIVAQAQIEINVVKTRERLASYSVAQFPFCNNATGMMMAEVLPGWNVTSAVCACYVAKQLYHEYGNNCRDVTDVVEQPNTFEVNVIYMDRRFVLKPNDERQVFAEIMPWAWYSVLQLQYTYSLEEQPPWFFGSPKLGGSDQATTVLLDKDGRVWKTYPEGEPIFVYLKDIIQELANIGPSTAYDYRGAEITITVKCYNDQYDYEDLRDASGEDWSFAVSSEHPVCFMAFDTVSDRGYRAVSQWTWGPDDELNRRDRIVVRIQSLQARGFMRSGDMNGAILQLMAMIVIMKLPYIFISFFMMNCLGHLSTIYKRVLKEPFSIVTNVAALPMRITASTVPFSALADVPDTGNGNIGRISKEMLFNSLRKVFMVTGKELDDGEIKNLVEYCLAKVAGEDQAGNQSGISLACFSNALAAEERITIKAAMQLCDRDRKRSVLERIFTPSEIWKFVSDSKEKYLDSNKSNQVRVQEEGGKCESGSHEAFRGQTSQLGPMETEVHHLQQQQVEVERRLAALEAEGFKLAALEAEVRQHAGVHGMHDAANTVEDRRLDSDVYATIERRFNDLTFAMTELDSSLSKKMSYTVQTHVYLESELEKQSNAIDTSVRNHQWLEAELQKQSKAIEASAQKPTLLEAQLQKQSSAIDALEAQIAQNVESICLSLLSSGALLQNGRAALDPGQTCSGSHNSIANEKAKNMPSKPEDIKKAEQIDTMKVPSPAPSSEKTGSPIDWGRSLSRANGKWQGEHWQASLSQSISSPAPTNLTIAHI